MPFVRDFTADRQLKPWAVVDSSYPFLVETPTEILCAYYSQHEDGVCKPFVCGFDKCEFLTESNTPERGRTIPTIPREIQAIPMMAVRNPVQLVRKMEF